MDRRQTSPRFCDSHLLDIHEVLPEEEEEGEEVVTKEDDAKAAEKRLNKPIKLREMKRSGQRNPINRQLSLETGFSVLKKESKKDRDGNGGVNLPRSGRSFGGFDSINRIGIEGRKADFSIFKTKSSNLTKQNSLLPSRRERSEMEPQMTDGAGRDDSVDTSVPAGRYFAALKGPELDQVKDDEDILLPKDELWPFLLRFPIGCFGICLGLSSQAVLWRALATSPATKFLYIPLFIDLGLWLLGLAVLICVSFTYILKILFYFEAVKREYFHPVRVNFFFAPWVVCMFLALAAPPCLFHNKLQPAIWCTFMLPYFLLELKIYGQWLSGGKRRLCKVANPSSHLSVVGNFVGAILAAKDGWLEPAKFLWAVGFSHYFMVFVTLYQRLPTSEALPRELHPVYSMFIAAPSAACMAWQNIYGEFDEVSRTCYFIALFLYILLVVRIKFFTGFRFSVAWWSYTFPMTTFAVATIKYAEEVPSVITKGLAVGLSFMSSTIVCVLFVSTLLHAFVWKTLFPNDLAKTLFHTITKKRLGKEKKHFNDIKRWTKQALTKNNFASKVSDGGMASDPQKQERSWPQML